MALSHRLYTDVGPFGLSENLHHVQLTPQTGEAVALGGFVLANRTAGALDVGVFERLPNAYWESGIVDASDTPDYEGANSGAKSTTANAFVNVFTTTNNDGFLIACKDRFNAFSLVVGDAAGGSPVFAYQYYNGSAMTNATTIATASFGSTGNKSAIWLTPSDWTKGTTAAVATTLSDYYVLQIIATTAPSDVCSVSDVRVYRQIDFYPQLAANNELTSGFNGNEKQLAVGSQLAFYTSGTANTVNFASFSYRPLSRQV